MESQEAKLLQDLEDEQDALASILIALTPTDWARPTPAAGWNIHDQVAHLADTEAIAHDTVVGGPRTLAAEIARQAPNGDVVEAGVAAARAKPSQEVLHGWLEATDRTRVALRGADTGARVPWGLGMSWRSFVTARLMEHWAHGLDIRNGLQLPAAESARLRHVARIGYASLPYALQVAGVTAPAGRALRLELHGPSGESWIFGPEDATDRIVGLAMVWCQRAVQRIEPEGIDGLEVDGLLAQLAIRHARAFL